MILLPTTAQRIARIPLLFRAHECLDSTGLYALSYGQRVYAVHTRAGAASAEDQAGRIVRVPSGMPRLSHVARASARLRALLLENATTNYLLYSQDFSNAAWAKTNVTVTANQVVAPDGTTTADKIEATASAATSMAQDVTTIATTVAAYAVHGRIGSGATECNRFILRNVTTATDLVSVTIDWTTGVVTGAGGSSENAGVHGGVQWWRIKLEATTGITSGDDLRVYAGFTGAAETAGEYAYLWQTDLTPDAVASSPVPTTSATAPRVTDTLYFPFLPVPQQMTVYVKGVDRGMFTPETGVARALYLLGNSSTSGTPRMIVYKASGNQHYAEHNAGSIISSSAAFTAPVVLGDGIEHRALLDATGAVTSAVAVNGGLEQVAAASAAVAFAAAWGATRVTLSPTTGRFAFSHFVVAPGTKTMDELRDLCEVG